MESNEQKDDLISNFCSITGVEASRGQFYLESANWNLQLAIQSFFEHSDDLSPNNVLPIGEQSVGQSAGQRITNEPLIDPNESDDEMSNTESSPPKTHKKETKKESKAKNKSNFATLDSLREGEDSGGASSEEGQAFYAGGSERSGQQVLGPSKKKNTDELVSHMFRSAKEHGAEIVDQTDDDQRKKRVNAFVGSGFKLGSNVEESKQVTTTPSPSSSSRLQTLEMVLKLWNNGFSIDDGPVRDYEDSANAEFLASIKKGEIPRELVRKAEGKEVHLNMEDHRHEDYVAQKKPMKVFAGEGHRLGNPTSHFVNTTDLLQDSTSSDPKKCEEEAQQSLNVDQTQPLTNIQIRLTDGTRLVIKINLTHTIGHIRQFICKARPGYSFTQFILMTTFPNRELTDETLTIKDANLANASIIQRLK